MGLKILWSNHLSRLEQTKKVVDGEINDVFSDETLVNYAHSPSLSCIMVCGPYEFLASGIISLNLSY